MVEAFKKEAPWVGELHEKMLTGYEKTTDSWAIGFFSNEHLKVSGAYWCIGALRMLKKLGQDRKQEMIDFLKNCQNSDGGFGGNMGHDSHITNTLYALHVAAMFDAVNELDTDNLCNYMKGLQKEDGSFMGDCNGEIDTRFSYCAVSALSLLQKLDEIDRVKAREFILKCKNMDGAFGGQIGAESHAAYVFTAIGTLKILGDIDLVDCDKLGFWLNQR